ncbi:MAG: hypothetical protein QMD25_00570 [Caldisericia bacterium]|jgi:hypothetical protein|nr:hypothetical protein [Caldisericia bacterium]
MSDGIDGIKKINIFIGEIGSGKTEISINFGINIRKDGKSIDIIDLDIYKPYIRLRDLKDKVEKFGVNIVAPPKEISKSDLPLIVHASKRCIYEENKICIYDIGGGENSTFVLRQFPEIKDFDYDIFYVLNVYRPFTRTLKDIEKNIKDIEIASGFSITGLVSNTNLRFETKVENIIEGYLIAKKISEKIKIPIKYVGVKEDLIDKIEDENLKKLILPVKIFIRYPYEVD